MSPLLLIKFARFLLFNIPKYIRELNFQNYEIEIKTNRKYIPKILFFLKKNILCQFKILNDIITYDIPGNYYRFIIIYYLLNLKYICRIRILTLTNELIPLLSISKLYEVANWFEREIWDLYGIFFQKHPDLRRILTDYGFEGHPLRKDFPLTGFVEIYYNTTYKYITYQYLELTQDYRYFNFKNPWN